MLAVMFADVVYLMTLSIEPLGCFGYADAQNGGHFRDWNRPSAEQLSI